MKAGFAKVCITPPVGSRLYGADSPPRDIARLSRIVDEAAESGDLAALEILVQAGRELAAGVSAIIRRAGLAEDCQVSYQGAVLRNSRSVRESFCRSLKDAWPGAIVAPPAYSPIFGAYMLGCCQLGWEPHLP